MTLEEIAQSWKNDDARIILAYAFNATGKTRLCVAFKDATRHPDGSHAGVYYNAFSEDLFVWDNDEENDGVNLRLSVLHSSLSQFHASITEDDIRDKLAPYKPKFGFELELDEDDPARGIKSVRFFVPNPDPNAAQPSIKISRGEERIFVWCFFLALFGVEGWTGKQSSHFFIDDPVSSLDDHNIFVTASTIFDLIEEHFERRRIIITTHHIGLFCILKDWLFRGEKAQKFKKSDGTPKVKAFILHNDAGTLSLQKDGKEVMLYHLRLLQVLMSARQANDLRAFHFALLRQVLENVASFLGKGQFGYVLNRIGITDQTEVANIINTLSHKKVYYYESDLLNDASRGVLERVLDGLQETYGFELHLD